ncbi:unnamed protein product [Heterobilharzia americana]|nr:unnamed protein product [Heterobilharzia americana]
MIWRVCPIYFSRCWITIPLYKPPQNLPVKAHHLVSSLINDCVHSLGISASICFTLHDIREKFLREISTISYAENEDVEGYGFGLTVVNHIRAGRDWPETLLFPRVAYCRVPGIRLVGVKNSYTAQCALPINMLNEKIYIFFWFWIVFLLITCILSLILWLIRLILAPKRKDFIKRYLRLKGVTSPKGGELKRGDLDEFIDSYLRPDGVFIIRMLAINAGEVITAEIVTELYHNFIDHYNQSHPPEKEDDPLTKEKIGFNNLV